MSAERRRRHIPSDSGAGGPPREQARSRAAADHLPRMLLIRRLLVVVPKSTGEVDPATRTMGVVDATVVRHHRGEFHRGDRTKLVRIGIAAATLALGVGALSTGAASASGGGSAVERRGLCSSGATWKLKAKPDNGRIDVEFEVDSDRVGQTWSVRIADNGVTVFQGTRRTAAPSGSFSVERLVPNRAGVDAFSAVATNTATGQRCTGSVRL